MKGRNPCYEILGTWLHSVSAKWDLCCRTDRIRKVLETRHQNLVNFMARKFYGSNKTFTE